MKRFFILSLSIVLGTIAWAKNVVVTISPSTAVVYQKKQVVPSMSPGAYSITVGLIDQVFVAEADGYEPQQFVIGLKSPKTMQINLQPNRKHVTITAEPSNAIIIVNGKEVGQGYADFMINKGESKSVKLVADEYDTYIKQINFNDYESIEMPYNVQMIRNRRTIVALIDAESADFYVNGVLVASGKNSAPVELKKGKKVQLVVRAPGYLEFARLFDFYENPEQESINLTKEMAIDHAYASSEVIDIANKRTEFTVKKGMTRADAIQRLKYYTSELFETLEINDNTSGWYRTIWVKEDFDKINIVRTRVEIKEIPDNGDGQIKFKFLIQSQIADKTDPKEEDYHNWNRVLKKYVKLVSDIQNLVN